MGCAAIGVRSGGACYTQLFVQVAALGWCSAKQTLVSSPSRLLSPSSCMCGVYPKVHTHGSQRTIWGSRLFPSIWVPRTKQIVRLGARHSDLPSHLSSPPPFFFETGSSNVVQDGLELTSNPPASLLGFRHTLGLSLSPLFFLFSLLMPGFLVKLRTLCMLARHSTSELHPPVVCLSVFIPSPHSTLSCSRR